MTYAVTDPVLLAQCFEELTVCDAEHRDRIRFLIERKVRFFFPCFARRRPDPDASLHARRTP